MPPATQGGAWTLNLLYSFTGGADGGQPKGNLLLNADHTKIYGTAALGGLGFGVVFALTHGKSWTETVLHSFVQGSNDGTYPSSGVISDSKGRLYGTTPQGGAFQYGAVFRLTPQSGGLWKESILYNFRAVLGTANALIPYAGLTLDSSGGLYGTSSFGGSAGLGTVFKLAPPSVVGRGWTPSVLYSFTGVGDGGSPQAGLIFDSSGALYGATPSGGVGQCGCGVVFQLTPPSGGSGAWTQSTLYTFQGGNDGVSPLANLIFDRAGALYGTTSGGGDSNNGTVFKLSPPSTQGGAWTESILHTFEGGSDGAYPVTPLVPLGTSFYGTSFLGGAPTNGTVFQIMP